MFGLEGPETQFAVAEDAKYETYFRVRLPDGVNIRDWIPAGTRGFSVTFIPKNYFDDFAELVFFSDDAGARRYHDLWTAFYAAHPGMTPVPRGAMSLDTDNEGLTLQGPDRNGLLVLRNVVIEHRPIPGLTRLGLPSFDLTHGILLGCLRSRT